MHHKTFKLIDIISYKKSKGFLMWNYKTQFDGAWIEFEDLSQYSFWDNVKSIDWLTSAKRNDIYIKKFQEEKEFPVLFIFDLSSSMNFGFEDSSKLDTALDVFKILALSWLKTNSPIGVSFIRDDIVTNMEPKRWKFNILRTFKYFAELDRNNISRNNSSSTIIDYLFKNKVKNNIIFLFSDKANVEKDNKIKALAIQNDLIYIHVSDSFENNLSWVWLMNIGNSLLSRVINFSDNHKKFKYIEERKKQLDELKKTLISIWWSSILIDDKSDYYKILYNFFVLRKKLN